MFRGSRVCSRYLLVPDLLISHSLAFSTSHGRPATLVIVVIFAIIYHYASHGNLHPPANIGPPPPANVEPPPVFVPVPRFCCSPVAFRSSRGAFRSSRVAILSSPVAFYSSPMAVDSSTMAGCPPLQWLSAPPSWLDTNKSPTPVAECPAPAARSPTPVVNCPTPIVQCPPAGEDTSPLPADRRASRPIKEVVEESRRGEDSGGSAGAEVTPPPRDTCPRSPTGR